MRPAGARVTALREAVRGALWGPETGRRLVFVHVGLSVLIGLRIVLGPYRRLAGQPEALFDPVPVLAFLDRMPPVGVIVALQVVGGVAALAAALRRRPRLAYALAWICFLVLTGLRGSRGKVLHNDLLLLWTSAVFLLAPVTATWRHRTPSRRYGWPVRVATVVIALIYFMAGYHKLRRSGIDWVIGRNMQYVMLWGPSVGEAQWQAMADWVGEHIWAARASAAFILGLEVTFPVALVWRRILPLFAVGSVLLHTMTWLGLGLDYWAWAGTVSLVLVDWPALIDRFRRPAIPIDPG